MKTPDSRSRGHSEYSPPTHLRGERDIPTPPGRGIPTGLEISGGPEKIQTDLFDGPRHPRSEKDINGPWVRVH